MLTTILFSALFIYLVELSILKFGLNKSDQLGCDPRYEPSVSVLVAARDEEKFIGKCIESILRVDYPREKLEIIIVDDSSSDSTPAIIKSFIDKGYGIKSIRTVPDEGNLRGKTNAINQGMKIAGGEIVLFTDADCEVPPAWIRSTVKYFDSKTGIAGGFTCLKPAKVFDGIQSLDWFFLFGLASAASGLKIPLTAIGNNLAVRKSAYDEVGGFENIPFSVTEDYALLQAVVQRTKYGLVFPLEPGSLVSSAPCADLRQLYRQKKRWGIGGIGMVFHGYLIMFIGWLAKLLLLLSLFSSSFQAASVAFVLMGSAELFFIYKILKKFGLTWYYKYSLPFLFYFYIYVLVIPFIAFFNRGVIWKERSLK